MPGRSSLDWYSSSHISLYRKSQCSQWSSRTWAGRATKEDTPSWWFLRQCLHWAILHLLQSYHGISSCPLHCVKRGLDSCSGTIAGEQCLRRQCEMSIGFGEGRFISLEECASALSFSFPKECPTGLSRSDWGVGENASLSFWAGAKNLKASDIRDFSRCSEWQKKRTKNAPALRAAPLKEGDLFNYATVWCSSWRGAVA